MHPVRHKPLLPRRSWTRPTERSDAISALFMDVYGRPCRAMLLSAGLLLGWVLNPSSGAAAESAPETAPSALASTPEATLTLTLEKALEQGLEANPGYQLKRQQAALSRVNVESAHDAYLPYVSGKVSAAEQVSNRVLDDALEGTGSLTGQLSGSLDLYAGGRRKASVEAAEASLQSTQATRTRSRDALLYTIVSQYLQVGLQQSLVGLQQEQLRSQYQLLTQVQAFFQAGRRPISDVYQQQVQVKQTELSLLAAQRNLSLAQQALLQSLGLPATTRVKVLAADLETLHHRTLPRDAGAAFKEALTTRDDLLAAHHALNALKAQETIARSGMLPTAALTGSLGTGLNTTSTETVGNQLLQNNASATVGLSISIPLFDQHATRRATQTAVIQREQQLVTLTQLEQQISLEIAQAMTDYEQAVMRVDVAEAQVTFSQQSLDSIQARYDVGASTLLELTQARTALVSAQYDVLSARRDVTLQSLNVMHQLGQLSSALPIQKTGEK